VIRLVNVNGEVLSQVLLKGCGQEFATSGKNFGTMVTANARSPPAQTH
jgi:hypothetical protein